MGTVNLSDNIVYAFPCLSINREGVHFYRANQIFLQLFVDQSASTQGSGM